VSTSPPPLQGRHETLADALVAAGEQLAAVEAYVDGDERLTFAAWVRAADGLAAELVDRGVRAGDVVAIMLPPSIDFAVAFAASAMVGAVVTGLNIRLGPNEVAAIVERGAPALVFVGDGPLPAGIPAAIPAIDRSTLRRLGRGPGLGDRRHRGAADDPAVIVWTSGTTGLPKGVWFDHTRLQAAVTTAGAMTDAYDRRLMSVPFAHAGYLAKVWEQLAWATTLVISPTPWAAEDMARLLVDERISVAGAVPTQWAKLLEQPGLTKADVPALRIGVVATAPAPPELVARVVERLGCPLVVRYAMTESPSITGTEPGDPPDVSYRTVGRTQAGLQLSIRRDDGAEVAPGEVGRIHVRGTCVMRGYWREPELTAEVLDAAGWLRSGDLGHLDPDGNLVLSGRVGDMYIRGGYNVYPLEVENVLAEHPAVDQVAIVGAPTPVLGERGVAFVVAAAVAGPPTLDDLRSWSKARLADYKAPDQLELVDALPLTSMMKVDKLALRGRLDA
jgi:acyl-CoA synthetase (AMP-forming)/AMP-acid ligase II